MHRRSLPVSGCSVATTRVDATTSYCEACRHHVTDLSAMTEAEARAWLRRPTTARRCISYRVDADATIVFAPRRAAIHLGAWLALLLTACAPLPTSSPELPWWCPGDEGGLTCPPAYAEDYTQIAPGIGIAKPGLAFQGFYDESPQFVMPPQVRVPTRLDGHRTARRAARRAALIEDILP